MWFLWLRSWQQGTTAAVSLSAQWCPKRPAVTCCARSLVRWGVLLLLVCSSSICKDAPCCTRHRPGSPGVAGACSRERSGSYKAMQSVHDSDQISSIHCIPCFSLQNESRFDHWLEQRTLSLMTGLDLPPVKLSMLHRGYFCLGSLYVAVCWVHCCSTPANITSQPVLWCRWHCIWLRAAAAARAVVITSPKPINGPAPEGLLALVSSGLPPHSAVAGVRGLGPRHVAVGPAHCCRPLSSAAHLKRGSGR